MFTGIIQDIGAIAALEKKGDWKIKVAPRKGVSGVVLGASVACDGICLTVIAQDSETFTVQVSDETLSCTTASAWDVGHSLNLERALRVGDELGGHIVSGHVDGVAEVIARTPQADSLRFSFEAPAALARYIAPKGSVALNGISLTVNAVRGSFFDVNIIPYTQEETTMGACHRGARLNLEIDTIARYVERMIRPELLRG